MSRVQEKLCYTLTGLAVGMGNLYATSNGYPKIGITLGFCSLYYLLRAIMIRPEKEDK